MLGGRLAATIDRADATPETVGAAMTKSVTETAA
jgi:hypothetical protein